MRAAELERALLGCMALDISIVLSVVDSLNPDALSVPLHRSAMRRMKEQVDEGRNWFDWHRMAVSVAADLSISVGEVAAELSRLRGAMPTAANWKFYLTEILTSEGS